MLTEAIIQTSTPTSLKIDGVSQDEILILESISGLSDVKVNLFTGEFAREGGYYQGRRAEPRNPVFNFRIQPNYADNIMANNIRELLYRMFMEPQRDSDRVQILLKDDELPDRYVIAYTETIQADMFAKEMKAQCGLVTVDAYLRSAEETHVTSENGWLSRPVHYEGSADTGVEMIMKVVYSCDQVRVTNGSETMVLTGPFVKDDVIEIRTTQGGRAIIVNGIEDMARLTPSSPWISLNANENVFQAYANQPKDGRVLLHSYRYRAAWWGI